MRGLVWSAVASLGCSCGSARNGVDTGEAGDFPAQCRAADNNALRVVCDVMLDAPGPVSVVFRVPGERLRQRTSDLDVQEHQLFLSDLPPQTEIDWEATTPEGLSARGRVRTGQVPDEVQVRLDVERDGVSALERLVLPWGCGTASYVVMIDESGGVRWYAPTGGGGSVNGIEYTARDTVMVIPSRGAVLEIGPDGGMLGQYTANEGVTLPVHHDVVSRNGQTLVLNARSIVGSDGDTYISDGLYRLDDGEAVDVWHHAQVFDPAMASDSAPGGYWGGPAGLRGLDFGHANSVDVDDRGMWLMSFKHLDTVMAVVGDPASPEFGAVAWRLEGGARAAGADMALAFGARSGLDAAFEHPHHARWVGPGRITLIDSGRGAEEQARVHEVLIDEAEQTAEVVNTWDLGARCPIHSSAFLLEDGTMVATCTATREISEFAPDGGLNRRARLQCASEMGFPSLVVRAIPAEPLR